MMPVDGAGQRGSASIWVLACSALVLFMGLVVSLRTAAVLARHRAEAAADLAALAAAGRIGYASDVCAAAAPVAVANGGRLVNCRASLDIGARSGTVDVVVSVPIDLAGMGLEQVTASARAGRMPVE